MKIKSILWIVTLSFFIFSCSSDDNDPTPDPDPQQQGDPEPEPDPDPEAEILTGVFNDSAVEGLAYETATQSGLTNVDGEFTYIEGETVTFKVGELTLGSAVGQEEITPITLAQTKDAMASIETKLAQNIAALLQTLDSDGDESNGITITEEVASNLGVSEIDFSLPIEAVLADIVLNVVQNTSAEIAIVYPNNAANNMANSLGIDFEAPENLSLTHLLPGLKTYYETWSQNYTPTSAIYKSTFDEQGNLTTLDVLSRYSGKNFFSFVFTSHNENGLPVDAMVTNYAANGLKGGNPRFAEPTNNVTLAYNQENQLGSMSVIGDDGSILRFNQFTAHDEDNRPLSFFRDLAADNPDQDFTISWNFTYENGLIATARRVFDNEVRGDNYSHLITTREFTYTYNAYNNLDKINYTRVFDDEYTNFNGELVESLTEWVIEDAFSYGADQKLTTYVESITQTFGDYPLDATVTRTYDTNELLVSLTESRSNGSETTTTYNLGLLSNSETFSDGLLTSENEYFADGSFNSIFYQYDENGLLSYKETNEYGINGLEKRIIEYYVNGNLDYSWEYLYDANIFVVTAYYRDASGAIQNTYNYTNNEFGQVTAVEILNADGSLLLNGEWEYDENGFLALITNTYADGYRYLFYYEEGVLTRIEGYDPDGNLIYEEDIDTTGKIRALTTKEPLFQKQVVKDDSGLIISKKNLRSNNNLNNFNIIFNQHMIDIKRINHLKSKY